MKDTTRTSRPEEDGDIHWMLRDADEMESPAHSSVRLMSMKKKILYSLLEATKTSRDRILVDIFAIM